MSTETETRTHLGNACFTTVRGPSKYSLTLLGRFSKACGGRKTRLKYTGDAPYEHFQRGRNPGIITSIPGHISISRSNTIPHGRRWGFVHSHLSPPRTRVRSWRQPPRPLRANARNPNPNRPRTTFPVFLHLGLGSTWPVSISAALAGARSARASKTARARLRLNTGPTRGG